MTTSTAIRATLYAIAACVLAALVAGAVVLFLTTPKADRARVLVPTAEPATPIQVTDAQMDDTFGHHPPLDPSRCVEDEAAVRYSDAVVVCLHREGDGWRVIDG